MTLSNGFVIELIRLVDLQLAGGGRELIGLQ